MTEGTTPTTDTATAHLLWEHAPMGIAVIADDGTLAHVNPKAAQIFGGTADELVGRAIASLVEGGRLPPPGETPCNMRLRRAGGAIFSARVAAGTLSCGLIAWWIEETTERRVDRERLSALFDAAPLPMMLCTIEDAAVLLANRRAIELFASECDGHDLVLDDVIGAEATRDLLARLQHGGYIDDFEVTLRTSYGEDYCGTLSGQILTLDGDRHLLIGMNDITDRKQAEENLRRFFDGAPLAMLQVRTRDMHVIRINRRASELFAQDDQSLAVLMEDQLGSDVTKRFLEKLSGGGFVDSFECLLSTDWGENLWANLSGQIIDIAGERCVLVGLRDITDVKRAEQKMQAAKEEAEQATLAKSQFLATMSHEIRTPMNGVLGMIDVLSTSSMTAEQQDMLVIISSSAKTLLAIIDDILDLSKVEAGKMTIEQIPLRLRQTVEATVELVAPLARGKGLDIAWHVAPDLKDSYLGDPTRLRQILLNLLSNAVKFTEQGLVAVRVRPEGGLVHFEVEDSGIGMAKEQSARLFTPFSQADASTTRRFGGTGLGLAICKRLVEIMGGTIGLDSAAGIGSRFYFTLPLAAGPDIAPPPALLDGVTVLVADPLVVSRDGLADALAEHGATIRTAENLEAALAVLGDVAAALIDERFSPVPFVGLADPPAMLVLGRANGGVASGPHAAAWAATGLSVLTKPVRRTALVRALAAAVGRATPATEAAPKPAGNAGIRTDEVILVAEDNHTNRIVIGKQLDFLGVAHFMVEDGEEALRVQAERPFALLLADCQMPRLDGYALTQRLREQEEKSGRHLPVIALTANVLAEDRARCMAAGMDDYLAKPVTIESLAETLRRWLPADGATDFPQANTPPPEALEIAPPIDYAALAQLLGTDAPETLQEIMASFGEFFPPLLERARSALDRRDRAALRDAAHAAKGAARSACAPQLAAILAELEAKAGERTGLRRLAALLDAATAAYAEVERFVDSQGAGKTLSLHPSRR